jgi:hypothetical protein
LIRGLGGLCVAIRGSLMEGRETEALAYVSENLAAGVDGNQSAGGPHQRVGRSGASGQADH